MRNLKNKTTVILFFVFLYGGVAWGMKKKPWLNTEEALKWAKTEGVWETNKKRLHNKKMPKTLKDLSIGNRVRILLNDRESEYEDFLDRYIKSLNLGIIRNYLKELEVLLKITYVFVEMGFKSEPDHSMKVRNELVKFIVLKQFCGKGERLNSGIEYLTCFLQTQRCGVPEWLWTHVKKEQENYKKVFKKMDSFECFKIEGIIESCPDLRWVFISKVERDLKIYFVDQKVLL